MRVGIIAGEASGDLLAAGLIRALRQRCPEARFEGVAGPAMEAQDCVSLARSDELAVMGLAEVVSELPRLFRLRDKLLAHWAADPPDVFIGVDAPDFNLRIEKALRKAGIPTVHYVSPTVWAWRPGRVHSIAAAADLLLCLFPFEPACYADVDIRAEFVGHPFAAQIAQEPDRAEARALLGLRGDDRVLAVAPGSRLGEISRMGPVFAPLIARLVDRLPGLKVLVPAANETVGAAFSEHLRRAGARDAVHLEPGRMRLMVRAADAAVVTSGTAALEVMLLGTPQVVAYRTSGLTAWLLRGVGLLKAKYVSLPNILAEHEIVPEYLQEAADAQVLAGALYELLTRPEVAQVQRAAFARLGPALRQDTDSRAADAVLSLLRRSGGDL